MIYSKPLTTEKSGYTSLHIDSCSDTSIVFELLSDVPVTSERRYCNKVLVHQCITEPQPEPVELDLVEFIATSDPCYRSFEYYKRSDDTESPIILHSDTDISGDPITSIEITFDEDELCCKPLRLTYRLYATLTATGERSLFSRGILFITPCACCGCHKEYWTEVNW